MDASQIHALLLPLNLWHDRALACVILLAIEGPLLVFVAWLRGRPWYELALAALPLVACVWAVSVLRNLQSALDYWQGFLNFQANHYPASFGQSVASWVGPEIAGAAGQGAPVAVVTGVLLVAGWLALSWWLLAGRAPAGSGQNAGEETETSETPVRQ